MRWLDRTAVSCSLFVYAEDGHVVPVDLADYGNVETHLDPYRRMDPQDAGFVRRSHIHAGRCGNDSGWRNLSFRVHGLEFARCSNGEVTWGLETKRVMRASNVGEIEILARELVRLRSAEAEDRQHPLFLRNPESWLESQVRSHIEQIDATLCEQPVCGQVCRPLLPRNAV